MLFGSVVARSTGARDPVNEIRVEIRLGRELRRRVRYAKIEHDQRRRRRLERNGRSIEAQLGAWEIGVLLARHAHVDDPARRRRCVPRLLTLAEWVLAHGGDGRVNLWVSHDAYNDLGR